MDNFINTLALSLQILVSVNRALCYLQVLTLSDITTGDGSRISRCYLLGERGSLRSTWIWHEERPTPANFQLWRTVVSQIPSTCGVLNHPVGPWLHPSNQCWTRFYCPQSDLLYHQQEDQWTSYHCLSRTRSAPTFIRDTEAQPPTSLLYLATIIQVTPTSVIYESSSAPLLPLTSSLLSTWGTHYAWFLRHCDNPTVLDAD